MLVHACPIACKQKEIKPRIRRIGRSNGVLLKYGVSERAKWKTIKHRRELSIPGGEKSLRWPPVPTQDFCPPTAHSAHSATAPQGWGEELAQGALA